MLATLFDISNDTHKGCPLSPLIFNILMEPLTKYIRSHPQIEGFLIGNRTHTKSLFVDNIILMLTKAESSLALVYSALRLFTRISYYKVNNIKLYTSKLDLGVKSDI